MGISNRDYMKDDEAGWLSRGRSRHGDGSAIKTLIILNVLAFLCQIIFVRDLTLSEFRRAIPDAARFSEEQIAEGYREYLSEPRKSRRSRVPLVEEWLALDPAKVLKGQVWRLVTYDFLHSTAGPFHLLFNMLILHMAGRRLEEMYGSKEFMALYLSAGLVAGVIFVLWGLFNGDSGAAIGASGAVTAVLLIYALHWPHERWLFMLMLPMPVILIVLISMALDVVPLLRQLSGNATNDGIAHAAHLGGWIYGYLYFRFGMRLSSRLPDMSLAGVKRWFSSRPRLKVHRPDESPHSSGEAIPAEVEERLDQLLAKIGEQGEASLTAEERRFLEETSRRYRNRR